jgi:hypothetical protein
VSTRSVFNDCLESARMGVIGLGLDGVGAKVEYLPDFRPEQVQGNAPGCIVTFGGAESLRRDFSTNGRDAIQYPCAVLFFDVAAADPQAAKDKYLGWREAVSRAFRFRRLNDVPESITTEPQYRLPWDSRLPAFQQMVTALVLNCVCRETRGPAPPRPLAEGGVVLVENGVVLTEPGG